MSNNTNKSTQNNTIFQENVNIQKLSEFQDDYNLYKNNFEEEFKIIACSKKNSPDNTIINKYLGNIPKEYNRFFEYINDKTSNKKIGKLCSKQNKTCYNINTTHKTIKSQLPLVKRSFFSKNTLCYTLLTRHYKTLLIFKNNFEIFKSNTQIIEIYNDIKNLFIKVINDLAVNHKTYLGDYQKYIDSLPELLPKLNNNPPFGGKKNKKPTQLQKIKLLHKNQIQKLKLKQKKEIEKLKIKQNKELKKCK